uniref:E3 ubiquitin-protein ligase hrd-1 n=1 Tax=Setaria digitata TaxID=48799 RepID=A0A915Q2D0_9BILA
MARASTFLLTITSIILTSLTVGNAFFQKKQFYPSVVYITKSSPSMAVIYVQGLVIAYMIFQVVRKLFFGELRAAEYEHLSERTWHAVMETCLAFTVFRDDFSPRFVMQFVLLLFIKLFHWLSEDRVDFMERSPIITVFKRGQVFPHLRFSSWNFWILYFENRNIRISVIERLISIESFELKNQLKTQFAALLAFLSALDSYFISHAYFTTLVRGASVQIVFGFEYAVLMTVVLHVTIKYILHMHDLRNVHPWENKAVYLLYSELLINCLRCILYIIFVAVMIRLHTFPLFSIRPLYLTIRAFHKAVNDVILSRRAIHAMNNLFPLATEQELLQGDNTCIICREEMTPVSGAKKLPCNHIFHANCLRSWFQRQQSCPTCRTDILAQRRTTQGAPGVGGAAAPADRPIQARQNGGAVHPANNAAEIPNMFPFMAQFAFPQQPQQQHQQQQQQQQAGTSTAGQRNDENGTVPQLLPPPTGLNMPQFPAAPPGFPFMAIPPLAVPPVFPFPPVPNFAGLTDEEVAAMEGTERAALEARITCIRNIGLLLDAATMQLQQYMSVVQSLSIPTQPATATNASVNLPTNNSTNATNVSATAQPDTSAAGNTTVMENPVAVSSLDAENLVHGSSHHGSVSSGKSDQSLPTSGMNSATPACSSTPTTELDEIRQRRLQKFSATESLSENGND